MRYQSPDRQRPEKREGHAGEPTCSHSAGWTAYLRVIVLAQHALNELEKRSRCVTPQLRVEVKAVAPIAGRHYTDGPKPSTMRARSLRLNFCHGPAWIASGNRRNGLSHGSAQLANAGDRLAPEKGIGAKSSVQASRDSAIRLFLETRVKG